MLSPCVSVVLPFFNAVPTLERAIDSIIAQTEGDWELLLHDDGSTDGSLGIALDATRRDPRIRVVGGPHKGIVGALADACDAARGTYLMRMDADDMAFPERMSRQRALLESEPHMGVCGTRVEILDPSGSGRERYARWLDRLTSHEEMARELFVECPLPHPSFFMSRAAYREVGGYQDHGWPEDYDLLLRFWRCGWRLGKVPEVLLGWQDGPQRLSMVDPRYSDSAFRALKRHHLFATYLRDRPRFHQWGAGEVGKRWLREWDLRRPEAVVDVHPRKIGQRIHGVPVIDASGLPDPSETFVVAAVGARGARDDIRGRLAARGYRELEDFLFLA
jgi:glycosyltransferase involved in cell wall biosynthesis